MQSFKQHTIDTQINAEWIKKSRVLRRRSGYTDIRKADQLTWLLVDHGKFMGEFFLAQKVIQGFDISTSGIHTLNSAESRRAQYEMCR